MANATVSGILDINNGGAPFDELALKVYAGMILEAYNKTITTKGRIMERNIASGKSAQFPVMGRVGSGFHTRGTEVSFQQVNNNERIIEIQDLLLAPVFIDILDEAKSHFEVRRPLATQQGQELAEQADLRSLMSFITASRTATPNFTGGDGGQQVVAATAATSATALKGAIYDAAEILDENSVMTSDRNLHMAPAQFYLLLQDGEFLDRDFGGEGSRATAVMRNAADFTVIKTTNLPRANGVGDPDLPTNLQLDYTSNVCVASHSSSAGVVTLMGLQFESEYDMNRQGHMFIAKYAKGFDYLRPEAAVEIASS